MSRARTTQGEGSLFSPLRVCLVISLVAVPVAMYVHSRWAALAVPVVWISAYCFGWYEGRAES